MTPIQVYLSNDFERSSSGTFHVTTMNNKQPPKGINDPVTFVESMQTFVTNPDVLPIDGLQYHDRFISFDEQNALMAHLNAKEWCQIIQRRQLFFGNSLYYHTTSHRSSLQPADDQVPSQLEDLSDLKWLTDRCIERGLFSVDSRLHPNHILVNEYVGHQGIGSHFDDDLAFGSVIVTISLNQGVWMTLQQPAHATNSCPHIQQEQRIFLRPGSCLVMSQGSRYAWRHSISRAKHFRDPFTQKIVHRDMNFIRVSLTVRRLLDTRRRTAEDHVHFVTQEQILEQCQLFG